MNHNIIKNKSFSIIKRISTVLYLIFIFAGSIYPKDITLTIHLRGVSQSKISLLHLSQSNITSSVDIADSVHNGEITKFNIAGEILPGEFVLRFDYKTNGLSEPYPSEKRIIINDQDLELWVHPVYCNNTDSTWFQKNERENNVYSRFQKENGDRKNVLGLLQDFLLKYDDTKSKFYKSAISEYEKRRISFNKWLASQIEENKSLFVSILFGFEYVPEIDWSGSAEERRLSFRKNYFDGIDFSNPLLLKTSTLKQWMDRYVNLYGELATTIGLRDSLFTLAGKTAIEKVKTTNPQVYGWMVDYFYNGFESFNIEDGIKMLGQYINDPDCLAQKKEAIKRRLKGIETLFPGVVAPDIVITDKGVGLFRLSSYKTEKKQILLIFWSADCSHCLETISLLKQWYRNADKSRIPDIITISFDETDTEIQAWKKTVKELGDWTNLRVTEGFRSKIAGDYFIQGIPVLVLLNSNTREIIALPDTAEQLIILLSS